MFHNGHFILSKNSIIKIIEYFPKIRKDILELISNSLDKNLYDRNRYPGKENEQLGMHGLCAIISHEILPLLKNTYPDIKIITGFYKLDKHPRFKNQKIYSLHSWLEANNQILDFTAKQFEPFVNYSIDDVQILSKDKSGNIYMKYSEDYKDVALDEDAILDFYISNL